jgi:tetratricopeptide (TPR) repeat protein
MRAEFLRAASTAAPAARPGSLSLRLLRAYLDLTDEKGPIHAQGVADAGRQLAQGNQIPVYQINTTSLLRKALAAEPGSASDLTGPLDLAPGKRSPRWSVLCELIAAWPELADSDRVRVAAVLSKLGFWQQITLLVPPDLVADESPERARLALLRCNALFKSGGPQAAQGFRQARQVLHATAQHQGHPIEARIAAAIGLVVHHARSDRTLSDVEHSVEIARNLLQQAGEDRLGPVTVSAYWRAVSFLPFLRHDHRRVREMLDLAEEAARLAPVHSATNALTARENLHPLLETRARACAGAGDADRAECYYRELIALDPLDAKVHVRLGDFLLRQSRCDQARETYQRAALLGVPYTAYALTQAARCSHRLGEPVRAVACLMQAVRSDPRAVTPLAALRSLAGPAGMPGLATWAADRLSKITHTDLPHPR